ncbi:SGNH/GDSL hydrolase family protein [Demequina maris]|uniref:SGNH/GDSL hydrolase family protein n=1 Tax=Demequina maris TaxID=1638982 RepID=UPI000780A898|nr:SGNH/GDSL hydrolase family protein [Demequina maris]
MTGWGVLVALLVLVGVGGLYAYLNSGTSTSAASAPQPSASDTPLVVPSSEPAYLTPVALFIGDANTTGVGVTATSKRWTSIVSAELGWREVNYARGGTGYLQTAGTTGCGRTYCANYRGAISEAVSDGIVADYVVISGGTTDRGFWFDDPGQVIEAMDATFLAARQAYPDADIYGVVPPWMGDTEDWMLEFNDAMARACKAVDGTVVGLLRSERIDEATMDVGDGVNLNDAGHAAMAKAFFTMYWGANQ